MKHIAAAIATAWAVCLMLAESSSAGQTSRDLLQTAIVGKSFNGYLDIISLS